LGVELHVHNEGADHVPTGTPVGYDAGPPASGPHWPNPAEPGFYDVDQAVAAEQWVHNLEHGYIVILYDCGGSCPAELLDDLRELASTAPASEVFGFAKLVITPYPNLPPPALITAVAWDVQLHLDEFDRAALLEFYRRYLDEGPELAP
jgi:hypothetical protein